MAEPEDLVLRLLREMREILDDHSKELKASKKQTADTQESVVTALGFAAHANVQNQTLDKRLDELADRVERLEHAR